MLINCKNVKFIREQKPILSDINWQMNDNENWAILGLNGSGKTTLLKLITGYEWPSSGDLTVLNQPFGKTSIPDLKKRIGWVSSDLRKRIKEHEVAERVVLSGKFASIGIWEDVTESDKKLAIDMLSLCGGKELIDKPYGVLSQGQQQIVIIARALMAKPELLIFDEPCNGLDLFAREAMLDKINTIANEQQTKGLIFVTHYIEEIPTCFNHVLLLKNGQIFAKGLTKDIFNEDLLSQFYDNDVDIIQLADNRITIIPKKL
ncbi:ABC transporter ATP-binding protein [Vagococcus bubulae]|uniref:Molybdenum ABC transporter ATP-binding protein n=1 Tax=Vagococcus bubulae TaxID=1977868 RepID=A0A429ZRD0_9ENTE|nr:ABC transporter ATP-binding protein [Vagococcus bubulae]RST96284.1 molybdenum ABC transporter ATP-binding protein [Vagococcus bubulae]